jgi:hypothetical protein
VITTFALPDKTPSKSDVNGYKQSMFVGLTFT